MTDVDKKRTQKDVPAFNRGTQKKQKNLKTGQKTQANDDMIDLGNVRRSLDMVENGQDPANIYAYDGKTYSFLACPTAKLSKELAGIMKDA